jgi:MFS family permease
MIAAMAIVTSSVEPHRRGGFLSANASVQHMASGLGAYLGGLIVSESPQGTLEHFGTVGWIAAGATLLSLWLAGRVKIVDEEGVSAEQISVPAAAEATADAGEALGAMTNGEGPRAEAGSEARFPLGRDATAECVAE